MTARFIEVRDFNGESPLQSELKTRSEIVERKIPTHPEDISELRRILGKETKRNWETEVKTQNVWQKDSRRMGSQKDSRRIRKG